METKKAKSGERGKNIGIFCTFAILAPRLFCFPMGRIMRQRFQAIISIILLLTLASQVTMAQSASTRVAGQKPGESSKPQTADSEIRAVLEAQVAAWNKGKLEEFMDGYWSSPELSFFSGGRKLAGWEATLERYRKTYQSEGREMGKLDFSDLDVQLLAESAALVRGRWRLKMSDGKELGGLYTLVFRRFNNGWKIVHDHTSSNQ
jgi:ketosteroid isomerase-like protein